MSIPTASTVLITKVIILPHQTDSTNERIISSVTDSLPFNFCSPCPSPPDPAWSSENKDPDPSFWQVDPREDTRHPYHGNCRYGWRRHRAVLSRMLLVMAVGLIILSGLTCFLSLCADKKSKRVRISFAQQA